GDGGGDQPTGNQFSHTYTAAGTYDLRVRVSDVNGCFAERLSPITVHPLPNPSFTASDSMGCAPFSTSFLASQNGGIIDWNWDFGDGNGSIDANPTHTYLQNGWYSVSLSVVDTNGCRNLLEKEAYIRLSVPEVDFFYSDSVICPGTSIDFSDASLSDTTLVAWSWDFGNGQQSNQANPSQSFQTPGLYDIQLTVSDIFGCSDSLERPTLIEVLRDEVPKVLPLEKVSVTGPNRVQIDFPRFANVHRDFGAYVLYRQDASGDFVEINRSTLLTQNQFRDLNAPLELGAVCYKVQVENHCGTTYPLELAEAHCTIDLSTTGQEDEIVLNWTPYIGWDEVEQYNVYRVYNYNPAQMEWIGAVPGNQLEFSDRDMFCYDAVSYRVEGLAQGGLQTLSDSSLGTPIHFAPTDSAHILRVSVESNSYLTVEWVEPEIDRANAIVIERDTGAGFKQYYWDTSSGRKTKFLDQDASVQRQAYGYRVFVVDSCGDYTQVGRRGVSVHLVATQKGNSVDLQWTPYLGWAIGVSSYTIEYFDPQSGSFVEIGEVGGNTYQFNDDRVLPEQGQACYRVIANESEGTRLNSISNEACSTLDGLILTPTAFSPNEDGNNDVFAVNSVFLQQYEINIFNRWGVKVFSSNNPADHWNGLDLEGKICPEGVYVFVASGTDYNGHQIERVGSVTLIR
ncbi:MAG: PKD domain-containing protein, partial [Bacteroidota bacterium]